MKPGTSSRTRRRIGGAKWQMKCNFEASLSFLGLSCIPMATAKEMPMYNTKLAPETELRSVIFFPHCNAPNFADTSDLLEKQ